MKLFENFHTSSISDAKQTMKFIFIRYAKATRLRTLENLQGLFQTLIKFNFWPFYEKL
jgi:hypothetical protein